MAITRSLELEDTGKKGNNGKNIFVPIDSDADFVVVPSQYQANLASSPDWGVVQFSLAFPIPKSTYQPSTWKIDEFPESLWPVPQKDDPLAKDYFDPSIRYRGIKRIRNQTRQDPAFSAPGMPTQDYPARIFARTEAMEFGADIAKSIAAYTPIIDPEQENEFLLKSSYTWRSPLPATVNGSTQHGNLSGRFHLAIGDPVEQPGTHQSYLELLSFEILQFKNSVIDNGAYQRYLLIHLVAVDCDSRIIDLITQSLSKPRQKVTGWKSEGEEWIEGKWSLLYECANFINQILESQKNEGVGNYSFAFSKGGYLETPDGYQDGTVFPPPARTVCAIPNKPLEDITTLPTVYQHHTDFSGDGRAKAKIWGLQMAMGMRGFDQDLPSLASIIDDSHLDVLANRVENWVYTVDQHGISLVRTTPDLWQDLTPWNLATTRYLDILIMGQRAYSTLRVLASQLRDIGTPSMVDLSCESIPLQELNESRKKLREQYNQLLDVQNKLAELRKSLWFDAVPKREMSTYLMLTSRREMGLQSLYDDIVDEVGFRREIHDLAYHEFDTELRQKETAIRAEEQKAQEKHAQQQNVLLFIVGTALAIPSMIAIWAEEKFWSLGGFALSVVSLALVVIFIAAIARQLNSDDPYKGPLGWCWKKILGEVAQKEPANPSKPHKGL